MASWSGLSDVLAAFEKVSVQADTATRVIVVKAAAVAEAEIKRGFSGSHKKGEPHVGGNKPNIVTGNLRRSVTHTAVTRSGLGEYSSRVGPTAVYGRRVELGYAGGGGGRGHQPTRAFPYFRPGADAARRQFGALAATEWARFLRR